jgi:nucleotide-binding universal stress UspA family protein
MRILVASNLSALSARALERGAQLAQDTGGALAIVHAVDSEGSEALKAQFADHARAELAEAAARHGNGIAPPELVIRVGHGPSEVADVARRWNADLVVAGLHHPDRRRPGAFRHTLAGQLVGGLGRPILIAGCPVEGPYPRAVVGVDFSVYSRAAIRMARRVVPLGMLHLIHAYQVPFKSWLMDKAYADEFSYAERLEFDEFLAAEMADLSERAIRAGVPVEAITTELVEGPALSVLRDRIAALDAPLAVVGTHGRTGIARLLLGSVAQALVDDPPADLLIVPMVVPAARGRA